jgi:hypothetical protein
MKLLLSKYNTLNIKKDIQEILTTKTRPVAGIISNKILDNRQI